MARSRVPGAGAAVIAAFRTVALGASVTLLANLIYESINWHSAGKTYWMSIAVVSVPGYTSCALSFCFRSRRRRLALHMHLGRPKKDTWRTNQVTGCRSHISRLIRARGFAGRLADHPTRAAMPYGLRGCRHRHPRHALRLPYPPDRLGPRGPGRRGRMALAGGGQTIAVFEHGDMVGSFPLLHIFDGREKKRNQGILLSGADTLRVRSANKIEPYLVVIAFVCLSGAVWTVAASQRRSGDKGGSGSGGRRCCRSRLVEVLQPEIPADNRAGSS